MTDPLDIAYCAGLIDGEGCIRIKKSKAYECQERKTPGYHAMIQVRMVSRSAIEFLATTLGGWHFVSRSYLESGRPFFNWQMSDKKAEAALRLVLPFLRVKDEQAKLVIALRELQSEGVKHRTKIVGYRDFPNQHGTVRRIANKSFSDEYVARCEELFLACKKLNRVGLAALED